MSVRKSPATKRARSEGARYAAPALDKGLDVIELLARETEGLTLNEIARLLGRTSSELFRMVNALCRRGYIGQQDDRYVLTLKLFELAHRHKPIKSLTAAAAPLMRDLAHRSLQSCHLTVFHAGRVLVVAEIDSPERWAFGLKIGEGGQGTAKRAPGQPRRPDQYLGRGAAIAVRPSIWRKMIRPLLRS